MGGTYFIRWSGACWWAAPGALAYAYQHMRVRAQQLQPPLMSSCHHAARCNPVMCVTNCEVPLQNQSSMRCSVKLLMYHIGPACAQHHSVRHSRKT